MIPVGVAYEGAQDAVALGFVETELEICRRQLEVGLVRRQPEQDVLLVEVAELDAAGTAWRNGGNGNEISRIALSVKLYAKVKFLAVQRSVREEGRVIVRRKMMVMAVAVAGRASKPRRHHHHYHHQHHHYHHEQLKMT